jgi:FkbM family methyltransferase
VFSFEFVPAYLAILHTNCDLNPALRDRIQAIPVALWDESSATVTYNDNGPGARVVSASGGVAQVRTHTIDSFVKEIGLKQVDFIKMDIEGAEWKVLRGAEETLRRYRPRLAIALYHRPDDFLVIPK